MDQHISREEWTALFSNPYPGADRMRLQARVAAHLNGCAACRELYEKGRALQAAARAMAASGQSAASRSAFRAVADAEGPARAADGPLGRLCVCVDSGTDDAAFIEDTLETEGCANKYALNPEDDGRCLLDDGEALRLELRDGRVRVALGAGEPDAECRLLAEDEEAHVARASAGQAAEIELPPDSFCTLELVFTEARE